jgi:hypothetical protein
MSFLLYFLSFYDILHSLQNCKRSKMKNIVILGGGTFSDVRCHLGLNARAFGETAIKLEKLFAQEIKQQGLDKEYQVKLILTRMGQPHDNPYNLITNEDVSKLVDELVADPQTKVIIQNMALCDFDGQIGDVESGKYAERLQTAQGQTQMTLTPAPKVIGKIRKIRKDIFAVGFKTTSDKDSGTQYSRALSLLKKNSLNLVLANDTVNHRNFIVAPEETRYCETTDRDEVLKFLVKMTLSRMQNHFTRSTVVEGKAVDWKSELVPANLRAVVDHCIEKGAYKPFLGKTAGHFAVKVNDGEILTSIRKTNFNELDKIGLVRVESQNADEVIAHGFKPSVGGQSQRAIFSEHKELDCIVHFHCPVKEEFRETIVPVKEQWPNECGSHECGKNTSKGLKEVDLGDGDKLKVVFLDSHGPNVVFNRQLPADKVIAFIDKHFDLSAKTGGLVQ